MRLFYLQKTAACHTVIPAHAGIQNPVIPATPLVIPAPLLVIPAQAGILPVIPPFLVIPAFPFRHSCARGNIKILFEKRTP